MASLSREEENYVRMGLLLTGISPRAIRTLFDKEFHPLILDASLKKETMTLTDLKKKKSINQRQWDLIFPRKPGVPDSNNFDVTLMITLLRNITDLKEPQKGYDHLPSPSETTDASDLARIKYYRNQLAHLENSAIDDAFFTTAWEDISEAIGRLGGEDMQNDCEELKTKVLDRTYKEIILEIKHSQDKIENFLQTTIEELLTKIDEVPPKNKQNLIHNEIEKWKKKDKMFVSTRASDYVIQCLQTNSCVTLTAPSGVGKSFTARHTSLVLQQEDYSIIPVYAPTDIRDYYQPGKKTVFIIDDICGNYIANHQQIENWKQLLPVINTIVEDKQCKIIVCCRLQIYKDDKFNLLSPFLTCECNLIADDLSLTVKEKAEMVDIYIGTKGKNLNIHERQYDFFPLLCDLFHKEKDADVNEFFRNPFGVYKKQIDELYIHGSDGKHKVCSLALCVLFNNRLTEKWFQGKVTDEQRQILEDTCEACRLNRSTSKGELKEALDTLDGTFIRGQNGIYSTIHDKLFDFITLFFGQKMIECLIDHGNSNLVNERFIWQKSLDDKKENIEFIIQIPDDYLHSYLKRLVKIWSAASVFLVMNNANMKETAFRQQLLLYLLQLEKSQQLALSNMKDKSEPGSMPLLFTCYHGYTDMVQWILDNEAEVNHCDKYGKSPLFIASQKGHTDIVRLLLKSNPDIDLCDNHGVNALYVACYYGYTTIVVMLLEKNPNVDLYHKYGCCHLLQAIHSIHIQTKVDPFIERPIVELFNNNNIIPRSIARFEKKYTTKMTLTVNNSMSALGNKSEYRPLDIPIQNGHTDIVKLLYDMNFNFDVCNMNGVTALYIASYFGFSSIVSALLQKNPNVDLCSKNGCSPLFKASQFGHTDTVKLLLKRNPSVDLCDINGFSPLLLACQNGFTDIVKLLLERNPNVELRNTDGCSPLLLASQYGHTDIVKLLLEKNPSIDLCDINGSSPLLLACQNGFTDIVSLLLERNPNVNLCNANGCCPLLLASQYQHTDKERNPNADLLLLPPPLIASLEGGMMKFCTKWNPYFGLFRINGLRSLLELSQNSHNDIVRLLIERIPPIGQCFKKGCSPLLVASYTGNTDMVRLLLEKNPNVDLCNTDGLSPLLVASQKGHTDIVRLLLEKNPNVDLCNTDGLSPFFVASKKGHTDIVKLLSEKTPNVDLCNPDDLGPLLEAGQYEHTDKVRSKLEKNSNAGIFLFPPLMTSLKDGMMMFHVQWTPCFDIFKRNGLRSLLKIHISQNSRNDKVRLLLEENPNVDLCNTDGLSPLLVAGHKAYTDIVRLLLEKTPSFDIFYPDGCNPLLESDQKGHTDIVRLLLKKNSKIDLCAINGFSSLLLACEQGFTEVVKLLLEIKPKVYLCNMHGVNSVLFACQKGHIDIKRLLLEKTHNVDLRNPDGLSPLLLACQNGHIDIVRLLLEKIHNVDICNIHGVSPMIFASQNGDTDIVRLLLDRNPNVDLCESTFGCSPLLFASQNGHTDIVRLLLETNPDIDKCSNDGNSPVLLACQNGHTDIVKLLLERNSCVELCNKDGFSPLLFASQRGHTDIVRLILERNPNIDLRNNYGTTALCTACFTGHTTIVSMLLEKKPNCDLCTNDGFTPLILSCMNDYLSIVQLLIKHKPNINAQTYDGGNALHFNTLRGNIEITQLLLENNADCNICIQSKQFITDTLTDHPTIKLDTEKKDLHESFIKYGSSNVKYYVKKKSIDYAFDVVAGSSPLHIACFIGWKDVVSCLLSHHADINLKKEDGTTPLFYACELGHSEIVHLLLEKGADTGIGTIDGKFPLNIAIDNGHRTVIDMMKGHIIHHMLMVLMGHV